ncbi:MAG: CDP-archaeol synthase [Bacterioplanes sp.]|nr:CDP-archaeol synthase [Bacterioplanes sp.]
MFKQRVLTALVLAPIMIGGIFFLEQTYFALFIGLIATLGAWEWANIAGYEKSTGRIAYAFFVAVCLFFSAQFLHAYPSFVIYFLAIGTLWWAIAFALVRRYPGGTRLWNARPIRAMLGLCVLIPMWVGFVELKQQEHSSLLIIYVMFVIWGADTGAYFSGKRWGRSKLAPSVSPGKSWAGFWGGLVTALLVALVFGLYVHEAIRPVTFDNAWKLIVITVVTMVISVLGDLVESMMKRHRGIKDSSALLPGHGGILDRIDSMAAAVPVFAFSMLMLGWSLVA